jgi:flagellar basal body-associated protein FliL
MTKYDFFALRRLQTHDQALRAAFTERMLQVTEEETSDPAFRDTLRADLKTAANDVIKQFEGYDFDIVEQVLITSYVVE